jgi:integrase
MLRTLRPGAEDGARRGTDRPRPDRGAAAARAAQAALQTEGPQALPSELEAALEAAERLVPGFPALIVLLAYTGMRIREALGLRWQDVDLDTATIRLRWQLARNDRTACRSRPTPAPATWTRPGDPVIAATNGNPKAYRNVRRALETISDELGIDLVSHDFRRSLASFLIVAARADEAAVTAVMGHAPLRYRPGLTSRRSLVRARHRPPSESPDNTGLSFTGA